MRDGLSVGFGVQGGCVPGRGEGLHQDRGRHGAAGLPGRLPLRLLCNQVPHRRSSFPRSGHSLAAKFVSVLATLHQSLVRYMCCSQRVLLHLQILFGVLYIVNLSLVLLLYIKSEVV
jgi:hypothetical protein